MPTNTFVGLNERLSFNDLRARAEYRCKVDSVYTQPLKRAQPHGFLAVFFVDSLAVRQ